MIKKIFVWINNNGFMLNYTYLGGAALYGLITSNFGLILFSFVFALGTHLYELQCKRAEMYKKYVGVYYRLTTELAQDLVVFRSEKQVIEIIRKHLPVEEIQEPKKPKPPKSGFGGKEANSTA